jgi:parallel beta-helix repeat protein
MLMTLIIPVVFCVARTPALPTVTVTSDDMVITQSCRIVIPPDTVIEDGNGNGVIQIGASNIRVEFAQGSILRGSPRNRPPNEYSGYGIRLHRHVNVTIRGGQITGFWSGLWATRANGLTLEAMNLSDNRRAYLKSTPTAEDGSDWLYPHNNDANEWLKNYGSAIYIEDAKGVTVRKCKVRQGQNALCLDRVSHAKIYDNDFSFNSGWGIALWRSCHNIITRNACDFCVRGYSHGVYNRGQDSAGILMFEQNCDNIIAENSATHSGDGFFGFAGREALGDTGSHGQQWYEQRGNSRNLLIKNDFSYAPAHGIEMTFSFGNTFYGNRLVENAICGVWGGYSQDTLIAKNTFNGNGGMAYGLERGGVNIEHGRNNRIVANVFKANKCGVHLWWNPEGDFGQKPWAQANGTDSKDNLICANEFNGDQCAFHFRGPSEVSLGRNSLRDVTKDMEKDSEVTVNTITIPDWTPPEEPNYPVFGQTRPVGARVNLRGRHKIIMTAWGPWDHAGPLVRMHEDKGHAKAYALHKMPDGVTITLDGDGIEAKLSGPRLPGEPATYTISATGPGVHAYQMRVNAQGLDEAFTGTLISALWDVTFFKWTPATDPREHLDAWRKLAQGDTAVSTQVKRLSFPYGGGGPGTQQFNQAPATAALGSNHFGMIARTRLTLSAGIWEITTLSDDGVRVTVDGEAVIDNWTWHGPTPNTGELKLDQDKTVDITVEHFEIDGYAVLELEISPK